jgi:hypothetical protein
MALAAVKILLVVLCVLLANPTDKSSTVQSLHLFRFIRLNPSQSPSIDANFLKLDQHGRSRPSDFFVDVLATYLSTLSMLLCTYLSSTFASHRALNLLTSRRVKIQHSNIQDPIRCSHFASGSKV